MRSTLLVLLMLIVVACDDEGTEPDPIADLLIVPGFVYLEVGDTLFLQAVAIDDEGEEVDREVDWASEEPAIASVNGSGRVIARAAGGTTIVASADGQVALAGVFVLEPPPPAAFDIRPDSLKLTEGSEIVLEGFVDGSEVTADWTSSNGAVVTIDDAGNLSAVAPGVAVVRGEFETQEDSVEVRVIPVGGSDELGAASQDDFTVYGTNADWVFGALGLVVTGVTDQELAIRETPTIANGWVEAVIDIADDGGIVMRFEDDDNYYVLAMRDDGTNTPGGNRNVELYRRVDGAFLEIAGQGENVEWPRGTARIVRLEAEDDMFRVYVDGELMAFGFDTSHTTGGFGLRHHAEYGTESEVRYRALRWGTF